MAVVLPALPADLRGNGKYPWDEWVDGRAWMVTAGEDFDCSVGTMRTNIYKRAQHLGLRVKMRVDIERGTIAFQFGPRDHTEQGTPAVISDAGRRSQPFPFRARAAA